MRAGTNPRWPIASWTLSLATLVWSFFVAYQVNGAVLSTVSVLDLAEWGAIRWDDLADGRLWLLASSQMVHVKWPHMLFNVVCLALAGSVFERRRGRAETVLVWLVAGGLATWLSPIFVEPPYNVGTGASQAVLAFGGALLMLLWRQGLSGLWPKVSIGLAVVPPFVIDLVFAGYPKIGHVAAIILGLLFGLALTWRR